MRVGLAAAVILGTMGIASSHAQRPVGSVSTEDAAVSNAGGGILMASGGRAVMFGSSTVTAARDHSAAITLNRGGEIRVCMTTNLHLSAAPDDSLLMGLDRGSLEIRMKSKSGDVVMTPDLRFTIGDPGTLDLQMRVTANGDTCVDNRGSGAPSLKITSSFGDTNYELHGGQHVMFEHGSLREVVDHENVPCGCPPDERKVAPQVAGNGSMTPAQAAAAAHPFPEAQSEGLAEAQPLPPDTPGQTHVQVATTLGYDPAHPEASDTPASPSQAASAQPSAKKSGGFFSAIGHFFKRLFVR